MGEKTSVKFDKSLIELLKQKSSMYDGYTNVTIIESLLVTMLSNSDQHMYLKQTNDDVRDLTNEILKTKQLSDVSYIIDKLSNIDEQLAESDLSTMANAAQNTGVSNDVMFHVLLQIKYLMISLISMSYRPTVSSSKFDDNVQLMNYIPGNEKDKKPMYLEKIFNKVSTNAFLNELNSISKNKAIQKLQESMVGG